MFSVCADPHPDALGADVAGRAGGRHGALSDRLLGNRTGPRQVKQSRCLPRELFSELSGAGPRWVLLVPGSARPRD